MCVFYGFFVILNRKLVDVADAVESNSIVGNKFKDFFVISGSVEEMAPLYEKAEKSDKERFEYMKKLAEM